MKSYKCIIAALLVAASLPAGAQAQQTKMLTADKHNEYGLIYSLPVTSLRVEVKATRTVKQAGPFRQYAKRFIGTTKVVEQDEECWTIESVKITPFGTADKEQTYQMTVKPGSLTSICVDNDGMLLAINKETAAPALTPVPDDSELNRKNIREYLQYVNEDFLTSQSTAKQAQMLSESLMEIRDAKVSLTRGTAETMPTDGRQLELMLNSLAHQEEALTAAFIGTSDSQTVYRTFTCTPDEEGRTILFRMSDFGGFVEADDYSGEPVYIRVSNIKEGEMPVDSKGEEKKLPKDGVVYNIPGAAHIDLTFKGKTLFSDDLQFAQYGIQFALAPSLFSDKRNRSFATFNPATGALVEIADVEAE